MIRNNIVLSAMWSLLGNWKFAKIQARLLKMVKIGFINTSVIHELPYKNITSSS